MSHLNFRFLMKLIIDIFLKFQILDLTVKYYGFRWKHIDMQLTKQVSTHYLKIITNFC